jgi:hypothetical protein
VARFELLDPKHGTMLRRGKDEGFNDQHFTEKLVEVERLELSRGTVRRWTSGVTFSLCFDRTVDFS